MLLTFYYFLFDVDGVYGGGSCLSVGITFGSINFVLTKEGKKIYPDACSTFTRGTANVSIN